MNAEQSEQASTIPVIESYVSICSSIKDQHADVREWLAYHRAVGVDKFYLVDTGSAIPMRSAMEDYIAAGIVDFSYDNNIPAAPGTHGPQLTVYERCLAKAKTKCVSLMFIAG